MRIRTIKPEFWTDERTASMEPGEALTFLHLINAADDEGRLRWDPERVWADAFLKRRGVHQKQVRRWCEEFVSLGMVQPYEVRGQTYALIVNFLKHQRINRPTPSKLPSPDEGSLRTHGGLSEDSVPEQGTGNREQENITTRAREESPQPAGPANAVAGTRYPTAADRAPESPPTSRDPLCSLCGFERFMHATLTCPGDWAFCPDDVAARIVAWNLACLDLHDATPEYLNPIATISPPSLRTIKAAQEILASGRKGPDWDLLLLDEPEVWGRLPAILAEDPFNLGAESGSSGWSASLEWVLSKPKHQVEALLRQARGVTRDTGPPGSRPRRKSKRSKTRPYDDDIRKLEEEAAGGGSS